MKTITCQEFCELRAKDSGAQIIDVREPAEYAGEYLSGTRNLPLSGLAKSAETVDPKKMVYVLCRTGNRAAQAAKLLTEKSCENVCVIEGGLEALKSAQVRVEKGSSKIWAMDRQVRLGAGTMVLAGLLGHWFIHPGFLYLSLFVACGLIFSAVTNTCGMALILGRCPWNQVKK